MALLQLATMFIKIAPYVAELAVPFCTNLWQSAGSSQQLPLHSRRLECQECWIAPLATCAQTRAIHFMLAGHLLITCLSSIPKYTDDVSMHFHGLMHCTAVPLREWLLMADLIDSVTRDLRRDGNGMG
eukprot:2708630-Amphidinium_carterae.2